MARKLRVITGFAVAAFATSLACGEKKDDARPVADQEPPASPAAPTPPATSAPTARAPTATADLAMLPLDSELVIGASVGQLVTSAVWKQLLEPMALRDIGGRLSDLKARCGIDPLTDIATVSAGVKGLGASNPEGVLVVRGLDQAKVTACVDKIAADAGSAVRVARDGEVTTVKTPRGDSLALMFVGEASVVAFGPSASKAVEAAAAGSSKLPEARAFLELFERIDTSDAVWLVMNGTSKAFEPFGALGIKPRALYGSIEVGDGFSADLRFRMAAEDQASRLATVAAEQVAPLVGLLPLERFDVSRDGADVKAVVAVTGAKLPELVARLQELLGGRLSMGMRKR
jgi:hypothetical protein